MSKELNLLKKSVVKFRELAGLGTNEPINVHNLLLKLNALSVFKPMSKEFSGMALKVSGLNFMLVNSSHSVGRQNFTMAHELYHLFVQEDFQTHSCNVDALDAHDKEEKKANSFASQLLMPEGAIFDFIPESEMGKNKVSLGTLLKMEQIFEVSHIALLIRLKSLNLIDQSYINEHGNNIIPTAQSYGFPIDIYTSANDNLILGDYGTKVHELFEDDKISEGHFHELLQVLEHGEEE